MKIKDILPHLNTSQMGDLTCSHVHSDSRLIQSGDVFVAITCDAVLDNVRVAITSGAAIIIVEHALIDELQRQFPSIQLIAVDSAREALSVIASQLYPRQPDHIYAVTGTNGKSSIVNFIRQILGELGRQSVSFGTVGLEFSSNTAVIPKIDVPKLTTPDAMSMHKMLEQLTGAGVTDVAFEASSHGLDQYRLHQVKVTSAGFTNLTQDHLDYHGSMEEYFKAKVKLFTEVLTQDGAATINVGCPYGKSLALMLAHRPVRVVTYAVGAEADLVADRIQLEAGKIKFDLTYLGQSFGTQTVPVAGIFQIENILCAIGMIVGEGIALPEVLAVLPKIQSARGRMEYVGSSDKGGAVYVDYAHTPDALMRALQALRLHAKNARVHVVFGCGGNRDSLKRPLMGKIADDLADVIIVTDDNPRHEDPSFIRAQIMAKSPRAVEVGDRRDAIATAIAGLSQGDVLLIAGKGHETGQLIKDTIVPFDDREVVRTCLSGRTMKAAH
ncbi:MAG: UDP-N-acetylmuramoyl-L-alanyl-D-glutamate--2,6-diaminopimelate ligase [Candidatus Paracaedibacteraceae bacterium]|nr:UDP-N-acetylmuramoyl-L-alanyl-D-glutamate--2,6-diaminopimelate ligase [Candidatus Paracaedibacteraceae bacterium]